MKAASEQEGFSRRLREALDGAGWRSLGASGLAREFNARAHSQITLHAARKWLIGEAIPTQERVQVLASWLGVSAEWLRFGRAVPEKAYDAGARRALDEDIARLDARQFRLVRELVALLLRGDDAVPARPARTQPRG